MLFYSLSSQPVIVEQRDGKSIRAAFKGPNPTRTSCSVCRERKRRCNGSVAGCEKRNPSSSSSSSSSAPTTAVKRRRPQASLPSTTTTTSSTSTPLSSLPSTTDNNNNNNNYQHTAALIPLTLDPLVLFLDNIAVDHFVFDVPPEPQGISASSPEERLVIQRFCGSAHAFPFEVFHRVSLMSELEARPLSLRYAFYTYCGYFSNPPAPALVLGKFYAMAKKAVNWCIDHPGLNSLQALLLLNICAASFGDMSFRVMTRTMAFRMVGIFIR
ncbi:hypothetical protein HDU67_003048, partial [Dinochytrium kinnereticum]